MSDTPRTDTSATDEANTRGDKNYTWVRADFARILERELAEAKRIAGEQYIALTNRITELEGYEQKYLLLSAQHVKEVEELETKIARARPSEDMQRQATWIVMEYNNGQGVGTAALDCARELLRIKEELS